MEGNLFEERAFKKIHKLKISRKFHSRFRMDSKPNGKSPHKRKDGGRLETYKRKNDMKTEIRGKS